MVSPNILCSAVVSPSSRCHEGSNPHSIFNHRWTSYCKRRGPQMVQGKLQLRAPRPSPSRCQYSHSTQEVARREGYSIGVLHCTTEAGVRCKRLSRHYANSTRSFRAWWSTSLWRSTSGGSKAYSRCEGRSETAVEKGIWWARSSTISTFPICSFF